METITLDKKKVEALFGEHDIQSDVLLKLYKMVFPQWDTIKFVHGWPKCNRKTNQAIGRLFMDFDAKHHPGVMAGGAWLNNGFSSLSSDHLKDWEIDMSSVTLEMEG